jgi:hypothetical protein
MLILDFYFLFVIFPVFPFFKQGVYGLEDRPGCMNTGLALKGEDTIPRFLMEEPVEDGILHWHW